MASTPAAHTAIELAPTRDLRAIYDLVSDDFDAVNELIPRQLTSDVELVGELSFGLLDGTEPGDLIDITEDLS